MMAESEGDEDQWLYGDSTGEQPSEVPESEDQPPPPGETDGPQVEGVVPQDEKISEPQPEPMSQDVGEQPPQTNGEEKKTSEEGEKQDPVVEENQGEAPAVEAGQIVGAPLEDDEEEDDDSDDDIRVTIGDVKSSSQYPNLNIKRGVNLSSGVDKLNKIQTGKFSIEEFESIGTINGTAAHEFSIDALEDKPWRKPGADITDYFNYGFNEDTWRAYCERQKQMRVHESGIGLGGLGVSRVNQSIMITDNAKYSALSSNVTNNTTIMPGDGVFGMRKAGPPPGQRRSGVIDVIGAGGVASRRTSDSPPKENVIQVMTAERRDYGRKGFDLSVPPPGFESTPPPMNVPNYPPHGGYNQDFYPEVDSYYQGYEPSQDMQWGQGEDLPGGMAIKQEPMDKSYKDRERDRERHKDRHRHRSRSRSVDRRRKHKSRSRSPGHRSHKKKKSKKSDRKDSSD